ncbi:Sodium/calcium exchanger protein-domain-containing protein [Podospora aff. communis PSN243]|uniref:Vacuolar calcium ion transporter n=1 Tax=Podospora aff. communis PSN243 TaxID=3040156 RepID=A0AAV9G6Y7_9PEZI|nr:Sodium/calcium exchanger protein-domain-containing protein [Podospora aff. communis PSN243]
MDRQRDEETPLLIAEPTHHDAAAIRNTADAAVRWLAAVWNVIKVTLLSSWLNVLLAFVPLGLVAGRQNWGPTSVFTLNFIAIIPLAAILSFATEEVAQSLGDTLGGLLNATFGNAVELIVTIVALRANELEIVQTSLLGSMLSNMLLVLGMCFLLGGIFNMMDEHGVGKEQTFSPGTAQTTCSIMILTSAAIIIPTTLSGVINHGGTTDDSNASILSLSRAMSVILLLLYGLYLVFALRTHKHLFEPQVAPEQDNLALPSNTDPTPHMHLTGLSSSVVLLLVTLLISFCAHYMVSSIDDVAQTYGISKKFIGLILIPIVGNAAEHSTACVVAVKDKMDLAMSVAIGSTIQIGLLATPVLVLVAWPMGRELTLQFGSFETVAFTISAVAVYSVVQDGKSNYLEGAMLLGLYVFIALAFWASPVENA